MAQAVVVEEIIEVLVELMLVTVDLLLQLEVQPLQTLAVAVEEAVKMEVYLAEQVAQV
jgi:hypothetical protein